MDTTTLAKDLAAFLAPFLPRLHDANVPLAQGRDANDWTSAQLLWQQLNAQPLSSSLQAAVQKVITRPNDLRAQGSLELEFEDLFLAHPNLAKELARLWEKCQAHTCSRCGDG